MKERLDVLLCERGLCRSREEAQALILAGEVWSGEQRLEKPGVKVDREIALEVRSRVGPFVSRAGLKLQHALDSFALAVSEKVCLDVGASTGGFTDCMLQRGARHVFSVDVGYGQIDSRLRQESRVTVVEKTNARYLTLGQLQEQSPLAEEISFVVMDVSFISLTKIIPPLAQQFTTARDWVLLFKPQFEVGREHVGKGGLVRSQSAVDAALRDFDGFMSSHDFQLRHGPVESPVTGKKSGNLEYLVHYELIRASQ